MKSSLIDYLNGFFVNPNRRSAHDLIQFTRMVRRRPIPRHGWIVEFKRDTAAGEAFATFAQRLGEALRSQDPSGIRAILEGIVATDDGVFYL